MNQGLKLFFIPFLAAFLAPGPAFAYVGPGAGLGAIGTVLALVGAILLGIVGFIWYPVKRLLRGKNTPESEEIEEGADKMSAAADQADSKLQE